MQAASHANSFGRKKSSERPETKKCQEIISSLDKFFAEVPYSLEFNSRTDGKTGVVITYTDFFSEYLVGKMLSDALPEDVHVSLKREYSDKAVAQILLQEYKRNKVAVVDCYNGELHPETIHAFVMRKLEGVEML